MAARSISVPVTGNAAPLRSELARTEQRLRRFATQARASAVSSAKAFGAGAIAAGYALSRLNKAAEEAATANARIDQVARSMGLFGIETGKVVNRLQDLARATALQTGVDVNSIKLTQAKLLTFSKLAKTAGEVSGAFDRATMAAVDMAAAGFGEASQNAVQLGKALQDPIKGITALRRSGITFTESERALIKTLVDSGKTLEAQNIILAAIETQVGGTAVATANASGRMREGFRSVKEEVGKGLAPAFEGLADIAIRFGKWAQENTATVAALGIALVGIPVAILAVKAAMATATAVSAAYAAAQAAVATANLAVQASTIVGIATATAAAAAIVVLTKKVYDSVKAKQADTAATALNTAENGYVTGQLQKVARAREAETAALKVSESAKEAAAAKERQRWQAFTSRLTNAKNALRQYVDQVKTSITGTISLGSAFQDAATDQENATRTLTDALADRARAYEELNQAQQTNDVEGYNAALRKVGETEKAVTAAQAVKPKSYAELFREQITAAKEFAGNLKALIAAGLGKAGLAQILDLGPVAGNAVAKDLLSGTGGLTVAGLNADLATIAREASTVGLAFPGTAAALTATAGKTGNTYNITVNAGVGDKVAIARQVVDVLQAYEKQLGGLPIKVK